MGSSGGLELANLRGSEFRGRKDGEEVKLGFSSVGESVEDAGGYMDTVAWAYEERVVAVANGGFAGNEVKDLFTGMGMVENPLTGLKPLLTEIELGRAVGSIDEMLQRQVAWAAADRFLARDHSWES
jgi:hypothetical protein